MKRRIGKVAATAIATGLLVACTAIERAVAEQGITVDEAQPALVLDPEPLAPNQTLATLDVVSRQGVLGGERVLRVPEGQVTVGRTVIYALEDLTRGSAQLLDSQSGDQPCFYLVEFAFTVHPPPGERRYRRMDFKVALSDPRAIAFRLMPEQVVSEEDVTKTFDIGFSISMPRDMAAVPAGGEVSANAMQTVRFTRLRPVITAFGDRQSEFYWRYTGRSGGMPVEPGSRRTAAVLQIPAGTERLSATVLWDVELERRRFGDWRNVPVSVNALPLELPLQCQRGV